MNLGEVHVEVTHPELDLLDKAAELIQDVWIDHEDHDTRECEWPKECYLWLQTYRRLVEARQGWADDVARRATGDWDPGQA